MQSLILTNTVFEIAADAHAAQLAAKAAAEATKAAAVGAAVEEDLILAKRPSKKKRDAAKAKQAAAAAAKVAKAAAEAEQDDLPMDADSVRMRALEAAHLYRYTTNLTLIVRRKWGARRYGLSHMPPGASLPADRIC
jgi:hypothetical protein